MTFKAIKVYIATAFILMIVCCLTAQDKNADREVIIIEKTVDQDGNVISKSIKRNQGNYSEEELNEMMENDQGSMLRSFDIEGMGFGDLGNLFGEQQSPNGKATLGVYISSDSGQAIITDVISNSGASMADIRVGDKLISIEKIPVVTIEEIKDIISDKKAGDEVIVVIWRDGSEIEKIVRLGGNNNGFDENSMLGLFGRGGGMTMDLDSIMKRMHGMGMQMEMFDFGDMGMDNPFDKIEGENPNTNKEHNRPQLGVFIEDQNGSITVTEVIPDSPASIAGLKVGDTINRIDDNRVSSFRELKSWMNTKSMGDEATLTIMRNGKKSDKKLMFK